MTRDPGSARNPLALIDALLSAEPTTDPARDRVDLGLSRDWLPCTFRHPTAFRDLPTAEADGAVRTDGSGNVTAATYRTVRAGEDDEFDLWHMLELRFGLAVDLPERTKMADPVTILKNAEAAARAAERPAIISP